MVLGSVLPFIPSSVNYIKLALVIKFSVFIGNHLLPREQFSSFMAKVSGSYCLMPTGTNSR